MESENAAGNVTRRSFLRATATGAAALSAHAGLAASHTSSADHAVILLLLVGGPSQLETFDPKPDAPSEIRGPFRSIATAVPGVRVSEHLPELARRMKKVAIIRSMHHDAAPIHETGLQLLQTGQLCRDDQATPHFGSIVSVQSRTSAAAPAFAILPGPIMNTGVAIPHGQTAGSLATNHEPAWIAPTSSDAAYGHSPFAHSCLEARRLVEMGAKVVVVNMYQSVFNSVSWDCHGTHGFATLDDYARDVLPDFDRAYAALIDDLHARGMLDRTMVVATGEFGRGPRINPEGGRDHWSRVWSALIAGGGVAGGQVIGRSDARAADPADHPVSVVQLHETMRTHLGIASDQGPRTTSLT